jgi:hypothetical protein
LAVQVLLTVIGTGGFLFFVGVLVRAMLSRRQGLRLTLLTPWHAIPVAEPPPGPEPASNG